MKLFSKSALLFSGKTCLAAFLALYVALELNLDKPAWALTSVYVVSQRFSASTVSKSVFRFLGTVLGGLFVLLIYPNTVEYPLLFSLIVSLWVAGCLYLSLMDRTPKSYVFMLAGYSAAIMGFPPVADPTAITYTVISRIEEITLGIVCSSLIHSLLWPVSMLGMLEQNMKTWYQHASQLCIELITHKPKHKSLEQQDILIQMANYPLSVEGLITHLVYEGDAARKMVRLVSVQYQHLSYLLPTLTAIEARLQSLAELEVKFPQYVAEAFSAFLSWLQHAENFTRSGDLQAQLMDAQAQLQLAWAEETMPAESAILLSGLLERLDHFVRISSAYQNVSDRISEETLHARPSQAARNTRHIDSGLLLLSASTAFLATFISCLFWIASGWSYGSSAPMMSAIVCSFFATIDSPVKPMKKFLHGALVAMALSLFYVVVLIPQALTFETLIICLAPGLFLLGLIIANATTSLVGLIVATQLPSFIALGHHFHSDILSISNVALSSLFGIIVAVVMTALIRNRRPSWIAKRAVRRGLRDLIRFVSAIDRGVATLLLRQQFVARMLDRVNFILPRKRNDPDAELDAGGNLIVEAWLGANCFDFYGRYRELLNENHVGIEAMFHELKLYLAARLEKLQTQPHEALLFELNLLLISLETRARKDPRLFHPLCHLFNVRLTLFPAARWPEIEILLS